MKNKGSIILVIIILLLGFFSFSKVVILQQSYANEISHKTLDRTIVLMSKPSIVTGLTVASFPKMKYYKVKLKHPKPKIIKKKKVVKRKIVIAHKAVRKKVTIKRQVVNSNKLFTRLAHQKRFTPSDVRAVIRIAAHGYRLSAEDTVWLQNAAVDIVFELPGKPMNESGGDTHCITGKYAGLVQFSPSWGISSYEHSLLIKYEPWHAEDWRMSGIISLYRMARVMQEQGRSGLHTHWSPTLGI